MLMDNYARVDLGFVRGSGSVLYSGDGDDYIDFAAGIGVCSLGHAHAKLAKTISEQASTLLHTSNIYKIAPQEQLATKISELLGGGYRLFFANSGAEANECAIKLARKHHFANSVATGDINGNAEILSLQNSFHGRTIATLAATGQDKFHPAHFGAYPAGFSFFNSIDDLTAAISPKTAAVIIELIQGEGGINALDKEAVLRLVNAAKKAGALIITDEVQCGVYRSGEFVASQIYGFRPDIITFAKGLAGGVPIGACASTHDIFAPGDHGSTFGGNFLSSAAALTTLDELQKLKNSSELNATISLFEAHLNAVATEFGDIFENRVGLGLMQGLILKDASKLNEIFNAALKNRVLILKSGEKTLRFLPPLNISLAEIKEGFNRLKMAIRSL